MQSTWLRFAAPSDYFGKIWKRIRKPCILHFSRAKKEEEEEKNLAGINQPFLSPTSLSFSSFLRSSSPSSSNNESHLDSYDDFCNRPYVRNCCKQLRNNDLIRALIKSAVPTRFHAVSYSPCVLSMQNDSIRSQLLRWDFEMHPRNSGWWYRVFSKRRA